MRNILDEYGRNAGKIWETLHSNGSMPQTKIIRTTKLTNNEFHNAIGWLARENKVNKAKTTHGSSYILGETNLVSKIGEDAGRIWRTLESLGENDVTTITHHTGMKPIDVQEALGWLAREDKIEIKQNKNNQLTVRLKLDALTDDGAGHNKNLM